MPVSSLIVRTTAGAAPRAAHAVGALAGVTSCAVDDTDLVVITETRATAEDEALWKRIEQVEGVLAVELIYHNFEDLEEKTQ